MEILIVLGIIYYAILLFRTCSKTPAQILDIVHNPDRHRVAKMCMRGIISSVRLLGLSADAREWAEKQVAERGTCYNMATTVKMNEDEIAGKPFFNAAKNLTEDDLKKIMESVP